MNFLRPAYNSRDELVLFFWTDGKRVCLVSRTIHCAVFMLRSPPGSRDVSADLPEKWEKFGGSHSPCPSCGHIPCNLTATHKHARTHTHTHKPCRAAPQADHEGRPCVSAVAIVCVHVYALARD